HLFEGTSRHRDRVLSLKRRAVLDSGRSLGPVLRERGDAAAHAAEHVHSIDRPPVARIHAGRDPRLRRRTSPMRVARGWIAAGAIAALAIVPTIAGRAVVRESLPASLTDQEFWQLVTTSSEPDGFFNSDNLLSNETTFQYVIPALKRTVKPGGVYVGVG